LQPGRYVRQAGSRDTAEVIWLSDGSHPSPSPGPGIGSVFGTLVVAITRLRITNLSQIPDMSA
ncbi:unnamed protein product, partial [Allacma fusca]